MSTAGIVSFLGGVAAESASERELAFRCGRAIGKKGLTLHHGGYNGLMEDVAHGASLEGSDIVAITLTQKEEWGPLNPHVTRALYVTDMGQRLNALFSTADIVIAMGGGVGTLHEITSAIWYAGNVRRVPVILLGSRAGRLLRVLKQQKWIYESPTRPLDFLFLARSSNDLDALLADPNIFPTAVYRSDDAPLERRLLEGAMVEGGYIRDDGTRLEEHFDPFRLCSDPALVHRAAMAVVAKVSGQFDAVAGIALGGVPLATHIALAVGKPLLIVRPVPKAYGIYAQVEGLTRPGANIVLVDDVVRLGSAMLAAQSALEAVDLHVTDAVCILRRGIRGIECLREQGVTLHSLVVLDESESLQGDPPEIIG